MKGKGGAKGKKKGLKRAAPEVNSTATRSPNRKDTETGLVDIGSYDDAAVEQRLSRGNSSTTPTSISAKMVREFSLNELFSAAAHSIANNAATIELAKHRGPWHASKERSIQCTREVISLLFDIAYDIDAALVLKCLWLSGMLSILDIGQTALLPAVPTPLPLPKRFLRGLQRAARLKCNGLHLEQSLAVLAVLASYRVAAPNTDTALQVLMVAASSPPGSLQPLAEKTAVLFGYWNDVNPRSAAFVALPRQLQRNILEGSQHSMTGFPKQTFTAFAADLAKYHDRFLALQHAVPTECWETDVSKPLKAAMEAAAPPSQSSTLWDAFPWLSAQEPDANSMAAKRRRVATSTLRVFADVRWSLGVAEGTRDPFFVMAQACSQGMGIIRGMHAEAQAYEELLVLKDTFLSIHRVVGDCLPQIADMDVPALTRLLTPFTKISVKESEGSSTVVRPAIVEQVIGCLVDPHSPAVAAEETKHASTEEDRPSLLLHLPSEEAKGEAEALPLEYISNFRKSLQFSQLTVFWPTSGLFRHSVVWWTALLQSWLQVNFPSPTVAARTQQVDMKHAILSLLQVPKEALKEPPSLRAAVVPQQSENQ